MTGPPEQHPPNMSQPRPPDNVDGRSGWSGHRSRTRSRVGSVWVALVLFAIVLLLLLIFVLQNLQHARISFFGAHGTVPQGVALLLAAVFGILLVALPGTARIIQLRLRERRHRAAIQQMAARPQAQPTPRPSLPPITLGADQPTTSVPPPTATPQSPAPPPTPPPTPPPSVDR
ncbi:MAG TPA: lipopolysaccharide assembly protein LapA domain-containing protein, partial [Micromonosporaceae bacterium]